jgi:hypothetical protein
MYSNLDLPQEGGNMRRAGGTMVTSQLNGEGGKLIDLETISGDIFVRKAG